MDISDILNCKSNKSNRNYPLIRIRDILNQPITILKWESKYSKFTSNPSGLYVELYIKSNSDDIYRVQTASKVIMDQLDKVLKKYPEFTEFTCTVKAVNNYYKLCPVKESE